MNLCAANFDGTPCLHPESGYHQIIFEKVLRKGASIDRRWDLNHCTLGIWGAIPRHIGYKSSWYMFQQSYDDYSHSMKPEVITKISKYRKFKKFNILYMSFFTEIFV